MGAGFREGYAVDGGVREVEVELRTVVPVVVSSVIQ